MKRGIKQWIASVLAAALTFSYAILPVHATTGETIAGEPETIKVASGAQASRETNFDEGWKFYLGTSSTAQNTSFDDSSWQSVTLPHDFSITQSYTTSGEAESGFLPGGTGWYRKTFTLPASSAGKTLVLNFDGAYSDAYVYVNGTLVGENHYGYTAFAFDITEYVTCDGVTENVVAVKVVNTIPSSRWYSGSGLYRDVTLITSDPVHVAYNGTYVTTPNISGGIGTVCAAVEVDNDSSDSVEITVRNTVYDSNGIAVSDTAEASATIAADETATVTASPVVSNPSLWSPDSPVLYSVRTEVYAGGSLVDTYDTTFR